MTDRTEIPFTHRQLMSDFAALGIAPGQTVMLHASIKSVGAVMGGPTVIMQALFEALTPDGTLMMYAGWEDIPDYLAEFSPEVRQRYEENYPAFDPRIAKAARGYGLMVEILRTWPGVQRSLNPEASMVAVGAKAAWITGDHPMNYGYGLGSPLAKLVEIGGKVLMLGAPLDTLTLLHHAENRANLRHKNVIHYTCPIIRDGKKVWVDVEDFNTGESHDNYTFEEIALDYLKEHSVPFGKVGQAQSYLFDATELLAFAVNWLETRFGVGL